MLDFTYMVTTKVLFGKNKIERLGDELRHLGTKILFVYGQGSIKKTGLYDSITNIFTTHHLRYYELPGVQSNPRISHVRRGITLCREHNIDCIVAVGGGSVIDCGKTIAAGVYHQGDPWEMFLLGDASIKGALPLGTVSTFAGSGSEMNGNAVISNEETLEKLAIHHDLLRPRFSILDPTYTFTVPQDQTAAGIVDIFSHILEQYFSPTKDAYVQSRMAEGLMQTCIYYGPKTLSEPTNYEARAQLMWTSSVALSGLLGYGRTSDWATHGMEHAVSALYDVTHGVGLAILTPFWMEYVLDRETLDTFVEYAHRVWQIKGSDGLGVAKKGIKKTQEFFTSLGMPKTLREVGIKEEKLAVLAKKTVARGQIGKFKKLDENEVFSIFKNAF